VLGGFKARLLTCSGMTPPPPPPPLPRQVGSGDIHDVFAPGRLFFITRKDREPTPSEVCMGAYSKGGLAYAVFAE
jgi:hypothetical protein